MILPYVVVGSTDDRRLLPLIQVRLHGPRRSVPLTALVDSGAEQNVLAEELAKLVGISLDDAEPVVIVGTATIICPVCEPTSSCNWDDIAGRRRPSSAVT